jgi:hypothetical protein
VKERLAEVGDTIKYGQHIPSNVTRMSDAQNAPWVRQKDGTWICAREYRGDLEELKRGEVGNGFTPDFLLNVWYPMTVKAVSPPPPPAPVGLPELPDGTVAVVGDRTGVQYALTADGRFQHPIYTGEVFRLGRILDIEGKVTPVLNPPRVWPKLDVVTGAPTGELPKLVDVAGVRYTRSISSPNRYMRVHAHSGFTLTMVDLRALGDVVEAPGDGRNGDS